MIHSRHRRTGVAVVCSAALGLALGACGSGPSHASSSTTRRASGTLVASASTSYGTILVTSTGMTLYMNTGDSPTTSVCTGSCLAVWPPLTTIGRPRAGPGVEARLLGTLTRSGGSEQVTYNGHPLYTFAHDIAPGQVNGEGIVHFGGTWYVLDAAGQPVTQAVSSTTSTSPPTTAAAPAATTAPVTSGGTAPPSTAVASTTIAPVATTTAPVAATTTSAPPTTTAAPPTTTTTAYPYY
jgi:predicted lipoprotein with Yx(FWY)xxD motif